MNPIKTLCAGCKKHLSGDPAATEISHGLCAPCVRRLYPEFADEVLKDLEKTEVVL